MYGEASEDQLTKIASGWPAGGVPDTSMQRKGRKAISIEVHAGSSVGSGAQGRLLALVPRQRLILLDLSPSTGFDNPPAQSGLTRQGKRRSLHLPRFLFHAHSSCAMFTVSTYSQG